ncbi:MAG TPA: hypothetical protein VHR45_19535 [Thermoanaerobaculia bacterium]|nr:hypothetical protein [Thermoanaerobaculia bacterium]
MTKIDPASAPLTADDWAILENVPTAILEGRSLQSWWARNRATRVVPNSFPVASQIHRPDSNYGFVLDANLSQGMLPIAGVVQDQLYDYPKVPPGMKRADPAWICAQVKEFVMSYFMRLTSALAPARSPRAPETPPPDFLRAFSLCGSADQAQRSGWGYQQWYYELQESGRIGKFPESSRYDIVGLQEVGSKYSWVVFLVTIYHFDFTLDFGGANGPKLVISTPQPVYAVMTPDFIVNRKNPEPGVLGEYGYGYSVVKNPTVKSVIAALPATIDNTIETIHFRVLETGEVRAHMDFITPQPPKILNLNPIQWGFKLADRLSFGLAAPLLAPVERLLEGFAPTFDPVYTGIRALNLLTAGIAAADYCITKEQLFKTLMTTHFTDVYKMFNLSASHFMMVPDWTDEASLPEWAKHGTYGPGTGAGEAS